MVRQEEAAIDMLTNKERYSLIKGYAKELEYADELDPRDLHTTAGRIKQLATEILYGPHTAGLDNSERPASDRGDGPSKQPGKPSKSEY